MRHRHPHRGLALVLGATMLMLAAGVTGRPATAQPSRGDRAIVAAGDFHTCALRPTGAVDCWGVNEHGQADAHPGPFTAVAAGSLHTCALTVAGAAGCWGAGSAADDQVGPYSAIDAGAYHTCALTPNGAADCWGENAFGQAEDQPGPYTVISVGETHTCAVTPTGAADCWGDDAFDKSADQPGPYVAISAGAIATCALTAQGTADCWGDNEAEQATDQAGPYGAYVPPAEPLPTAAATALPLPSATPTTPSPTRLPGTALRVFVPQVLGRVREGSMPSVRPMRDAHTDVLDGVWLLGGLGRLISLLNPPLAPPTGAVSAVLDVWACHLMRVPASEISRRRGRFERGDRSPGHMSSRKSSISSCPASTI